MPKQRLVVVNDAGIPQELEQESNQCLFRCIFEQAGVGVAEVALSSLQILRANAELARLLSRDNIDLAGVCFLDLGLSLDAESPPQSTMASQFSRIQSGIDKSNIWYASYQNHSSQLCYFKFTASVIPNDAVPPQSCIVILDDISDQKNAERRLKELHQQLEQRVAQRTAELESANESLRIQVSDRRRIEEALRQSVALYRTIAASIPDAAVLVISSDLRFRVAEGLLLEQIGTSRAKLEGTVAGRTEQGQTGQILLAVFQQALAGESASCERRCAQRSLYLLYTPLRNSECEIIGAVILALDITARKQTEEARLQLEKQYLQIVETANEGIWAVDRDFRTTFVNDRMAELLGTSRQAMIGAESSRYIFVEDLPAHQHRKQQRRAGNHERYEARFRREDGSSCWLQASVTVVLDDSGLFNGSFGMFTDISQRREAASLLSASEKRFRAIIESSTEGILVFASGSRFIRYANPRACEMLQLSADDLVGYSFGDLFSPLSRHDRVPTSPYQAGHTGEFLRKDGVTLRVGMKTVVLDLEGEQCVVLFLTDLTARSMLEQERLKAQKLDAIGTLAGGIAHDFNNLLQAIYANISMVRWAYDNKEEALARLESVEQSLHMAIKLTRQLLGFSKGATIQKRKMVLGPLIEEATRFILSGAKASCEIDIDPKLWAAEVDEGQIHQVIHNIVLNADQSMPFGGNIQVVARNVLTPQEGLPPAITPGRWISVMVKDSGVGIAEEHMNRIFDPYFSTKSTGTGLGLATTYAVVRKHDGYIDVKSKLGEGTTVTMFLPASDGQEEAVHPIAAAPSVRALTVLLLDDDPIVLATSQALLQVLGHEVVPVEHGEAAIVAYREALSHGKPFDLVLLDLTIRGGMGGMETLRRLRKFHPNVKAILTSGYSDESLSPSDLPSQARLFLPKPYTLEQLRDAILYTVGDNPQNHPVG